MNPDAPLSLSFRDFDWGLLRMVLLLCTISVLEIYSATLHTKFAGFHTKQMFWILRRHRGDVYLRRRSTTTGCSIYPVGLRVLPVALVAVKLVGHQGAGRAALDQARADAFSAFGVGEAGADPGGGALFCQPRRAHLTWKDIFKAFALVGVPMLLVLIQPDLGTALTYTPILIAGLFLGGINLKQAAISDDLRGWCWWWACGRAARF